jgi:hypothetical protein
VVLGDENGVVIVPRDRAEAVLEAARHLQAKEEGIRRRILKGETLYDILGLNSIFPESSEERRGAPEFIERSESVSKQ